MSEQLRLLDADADRGGDVEASWGPGLVILRGFASARASALLQQLERVAARAPWRQMETPGGGRMSVATTSCGRRGWVSDRRGYRYVRRDPGSGEPWPPIPGTWVDLARDAARRAGYHGFSPDTCLVNRYDTGSKMGLHQDRDERDFDSPIVSVSLGVDAVFLWGGDTRSERPERIAVRHGDVAVFGGPARLRFHGVAPLSPGRHSATGTRRINLTLRRVG